jgi:hypothetical protein
MAAKTPEELEKYHEKMRRKQQKGMKMKIK